MIQTIFKRFAATLLLLSMVSFGVQAQWTLTGSNIYNTNSGNVGIGTTNPMFKLELVGNGQILRNTSATSYSSLRLYNNQNLPTRSLEIDYSGSSYSGSLLSGGPTGEAASITTTGAFPLMFGTGNAMKMIITSAGNIGIGTAAPTNRFEVSGSTFNRISARVSSDVQTGFQAIKTGINATDWEFYIPAGSTDFRFYNATNGADVITMKNNGNVGISTTGTGSVLARLTIRGSTWSNATRTNAVFSGIVGTDHANYIGSEGYWAMRTALDNSFNLDVYNASNPKAALTVLQNGKIGIGTISPDETLTVNGTVHAKEVKIDLSVPGPDYVFDKDYKLLSLEDVRAYIEKHHHLPDVPSAAEMEKNGVNVSEMNMTLLKKVEELTLYVLQLKSEIEGLRKKK